MSGMAMPKPADRSGTVAAGAGAGASTGMSAPPAVIASAVPATTATRRGATDGGLRCRCSIASCSPIPGIMP
jgi:hypothetical protein